MSRFEKILVVDDEEDMLENCRRILERSGYRCLISTSVAEALELISSERFNVVLTDLRMPQKDGLELLKAAKQLDPEIVVILFTAYATIETAVQAIKEGAFDYIPKPFSADQLQLVVKRALKQRELTIENLSLRRQLRASYRFDKIISKSEAMERVFEMVKKISETDVNVIIEGETGTGKELIARSVHANSQRFGKPFVPIDCASLPENLLESELFGYEKGAFTGADSTRPGLLEHADGGSLFLDEVGELPLNLQPKLLRVLQERQFRRVGGRNLIDVDLRIISASDRNLEEAVRNGQFREELFYRLNVVVIKLPPLRQRSGDIPLLAEHFLNEFSYLTKKPIRKISEEALRLLENYHWPGNVRELQNVIERAVSLSEGELIKPEDLPTHIREKKGIRLGFSSEESPFKHTKELMIESFEKEYLISLLKKHHFNISQVAKEAQIDRRTVHRLINKYDIRVFRN